MLIGQPPQAAGIPASAADNTASETTDRRSRARAGTPPRQSPARYHSFVTTTPTSTSPSGDTTPRSCHQSSSHTSGAHAAPRTARLPPRAAPAARPREAPTRTPRSPLPAPTAAAPAAATRRARPTRVRGGAAARSGSRRRARPALPRRSCLGCTAPRPAPRGKGTRCAGLPRAQMR
ncbi:MAG: hypothetical protein J3K34DRAFT_29613 [Monoraphidium minutum]|nr:MAG: hypothetical protein J3K34DRAFT_29613 [Monoraphidium minutum]